MASPSEGQPTASVNSLVFAFNSELAVYDQGLRHVPENEIALWNSPEKVFF